MFIRHINLSFFDRMDTSNSRVQIQDYYDRVALTKALPLLTFRRFGQTFVYHRIRDLGYASRAGEDFLRRRLRSLKA